MSSPRVLEACQEESISRAQWLEEELVGPSLGVLVGELMVMAGPAAAAERQLTAEQAAEWLGRDLHPVLSAGLGTLPKEKLDELFRRPAILGGLQELVLVEGGEHWDGLVGRSDVFKATAAFHRRQLAQRLGFADQADPLTTTGQIQLPAAAPPAGRSRWLPAALITLTGLAAAVLAALILPGLPVDREAPPAGTADQPGQLAATESPPTSVPPSPAPPKPEPPKPEPPKPEPPKPVPPGDSPPTAIVSVQTPEPRNPTPTPTPPAPPPKVPVVPVPAPAPSPQPVVVDPAGPPPGDRRLQAAVVVPHHPWVALLAGPRPEPVSEELLARLATESRNWSRNVSAAEQVSASDLALAVEEAQRAVTDLNRVLAGPRGSRVPAPRLDSLRRACRQANDAFRRVDEAIRGPESQRGDLGEHRQKLLEALDTLERALDPPARDPV